MTNPLVHALVFVAAVLIPGGLLVYFAWRAISLKRGANQDADADELEYIPETLPDSEEAIDAFRQMYPHHPPDSLRAQNRLKRLQFYKTRPRKKS